MNTLEKLRTISNAVNTMLEFNRPINLATIMKETSLLNKAKVNFHDINLFIDLPTFKLVCNEWEKTVCNNFVRTVVLMNDDFSIKGLGTF